MPDYLQLTRELCAYSTGIVARENEALFARIGKELRLRLFRYKSGETYNGWVVPDLWTARRAEIRKDGRLIYDGMRHPLGVAYYSRSFHGRLSASELKAHLFTNPALPDAYMWHCSWLYRPWEHQWGLCPPHSVVEALEEGDYDVDLETVFEPGEALLAQHEHRGSSDRTVVFHTNHCHPHMANDGLAGTAVMIRLFQWLATQQTTYTYRLVIGPEHIGTVFYLRDMPKDELANLVCGVFGEMMGTPGPFKVASSFTGTHAIDRIFRHVVLHHAENPEFVPFRKSVGNDETVWEAPGYEVPFVQVNRAIRFGDPFPEYHSSLDTPDLMQHALLDEFFEIFKKVVFVLENNVVMERRFEGLIALSNPQYDLYVHRVDPSVRHKVDGIEREGGGWGYLQDCIPRYFDGRTTLLDVAEAHDLPFTDLWSYVKRFEEKGLIALKSAAMTARSEAAGLSVATRQFDCSMEHSQGAKG